MHGSFSDLSISKIREIIDPAKIDYIVVQHTEPDHSGSLAELLEACPNAEVYSTKLAARWIKAIIKRDFKSHIIEDEEELKLGKRTLQFMKILKYSHNLLTGTSIQITCRLITQYDGRICNDGPRNGHTLLLSTRKLVWPMIYPVPKSYAFQSLYGSFLRII